VKAKTRMLLASIATLVGIVVGAGFLGIPKALTLSGYAPGVLIMVIVAFFMLIMCLFATELSLNTKKEYQMPGIIRKYLGSKIGLLSGIIFALISFGAMTAYLLGCSSILSEYTSINQNMIMMVYFAVIFFIVYKGLKLIEKAELYLGIGIIIFLAILTIILGNNFNADNLFSFETSNLIIPLGVIIFSFGGFNVMTQIEQITNGDKNLMVKTSVIGMFIPFIFFLAFSTLMLGVFGNNIVDIATESLTGIIGIIGNTIAFLAMTSSYIISGLLLKDMLIDDYNIGKTKSTLLAMFSPLIFILIASPNFINTLAFTGALLSGLFAIIVAFAVIKHRKIIRKKYYETPGGIITPIFTILFFIIGIISIIID